MRYAQTIAMAVDLLADGRADDVARMVEPLLTPLSDADADDGMVRLHSLAACIDTVHTGRPERALERLRPVEPASAREAFGGTARADAALWLGWAHAFRDSTSDEEARALSLFDEALSLYTRHHNLRGRCWTRLGQARAYFALDEYNLMRRALDEAASLLDKVDDALAARWLHDLRVPALRFEGRYEDARLHMEALADIGRERGDARIQGHAAAQRAALTYDLGGAPEEVIDAAKRAEQLLASPAQISNYSLLAAYHAHIGAHLRTGHLDEASAVIDRAASTVAGYAVGETHLQTLRARIALRRGNTEAAEQLLEDLFEQAHHLPHGLHRSHVALLRAELLARNNELRDADTWVQRALRNARETGHRGHQLRSLCTRVTLLVRSERIAQAQAVMESISAYSDYDTVLPYVVLRATADGDVQRALGRIGDARIAYSVARSAAAVIQDTEAGRSLSDRLASLGLSDDVNATRITRSRDVTTDRRGVEEPRATYADDEDSSHNAPAIASESDAVEEVIGALLAQASRSVPLVAETWIQTIKPLFPETWIGVYRRTASGSLERLHAAGTDPDALPGPTARSRHESQTPVSQNDLSPAPTPSTNGSPASREGHTPSPARAESEIEDSALTHSIRWIPLAGASATPCYFGIQVPPPSQALEASVRSSLQRIHPWLPVLGLAIEHAEQHRTASRLSVLQTPSGIPVDGFVAESPAMQGVAQQLRRIQSSHSPVLVTGERGAGMLRVAEAVHATSERTGEPCTIVRCSSMQRDPLDTQLFGDARGETFTPGAFQASDGGTVILQDVDALPESVQDRLINAIETGDVVPNGTGTSTPVDVRVVATSSADLRTAIREGRFREDLYLHLNVIPIRVPPLRDRREDIPLLVRHYVDALRPDGTPPVSVTSQALSVLLQYDWPGNVRQLRNEIERALLLVHAEPAPLIDEALLSDAIREAIDDAPLPPDRAPAARSASTTAPRPDTVLQTDTSLNDVLAATEAAVIERVLAACDGQITASADVLGLTRQGLYKKMKRLNIDATAFQPSTAST